MGVCDGSHELGSVFSFLLFPSLGCPCETVGATSSQSRCRSTQKEVICTKLICAVRKVLPFVLLETGRALMEA